MPNINSKIIMNNEIDGLFKSDVDLKDKIQSFFEKHIRHLCKAIAEA